MKYVAIEPNFNLLSPHLLLVILSDGRRSQSFSRLSELQYVWERHKHFYAFRGEAMQLFVISITRLSHFQTQY